MLWTTHCVIPCFRALHFHTPRQAVASRLLSVLSSARTLTGGCLTTGMSMASVANGSESYDFDLVTIGAGTVPACWMCGCFVPSRARWHLCIQQPLMQPQ